MLQNKQKWTVFYQAKVCFQLSSLLRWLHFEVSPSGYKINWPPKAGSWLPEIPSTLLKRKKHGGLAASYHLFWLQREFGYKETYFNSSPKILTEESLNLFLITYFIVSRGNVSFMLETTWLTGLNFSPTGDQEGAILNPAHGSSFTNLLYFNNKAHKASWRNHGRGRKQIPHFYWDKETGWWTDKKDAQGWVSVFCCFFFFFSL